MSRIGKLPIQLPTGVTVSKEGTTVKIAGPKGELSYVHNPVLSVEETEGTLFVKPKAESRESASLWGLTRTLVANMVKGVSEGFEKKLEYHGVGYRANMEGRTLVMHLGFSHPVRYDAPEGIDIKVEKNVITIAGIDKQLVGQVAAEIRSLKKPEPYKGKGIRYQDERIRRKAGKAAAKG